MSFNAYLVGVITFLTISYPFICLYAFMRGYALGVKDHNTAHPDTPKADIPRPAKHIPTATDKNLKMYETLLENIENYDGTDAHQKEIK